MNHDDLTRKKVFSLQFFNLIKYSYTGDTVCRSHPLRSKNARPLSAVSTPAPLAAVSPTVARSLIAAVRCSLVQSVCSCSHYSSSRAAARGARARAKSFPPSLANPFTHEEPPAFSANSTVKIYEKSEIILLNFS